MDGWTMVIVAVAIVAAVMFGVAILIPYMLKRGVKVDSVLESTSTALSTADMVIDGLTGIFPGVTALTIVDKIIDYAQQGIKAAEQMYKATLIAAEERKAKATDIIYECLKVAGIEATPDVKKVVDGMIEAAVFSLPKTAEEGIGIDGWTEEQLRAFCQTNGINVDGCENREAILARLDEYGQTEA